MQAKRPKPWIWWHAMFSTGDKAPDAAFQGCRQIDSHPALIVRGAQDGQEALELLTHFRFDLVLSDLKMPRMDGVTLARHIISTVRTPTLLMTGDDFDDLRSIQEFGVPCLGKPLSLQELLVTVQNVLSGSGAV